MVVCQIGCCVTVSTLYNLAAAFLPEATSNTKQQAKAMSSDDEENELSSVSEAEEWEPTADDILLFEAVQRSDPAGVQEALWTGANVNCIVGLVPCP